MFRTGPLSIIRSFSLYTQQWCISYRFADSLLASCQQTWWWTEDPCETCRVLFQKNKFEKLVNLVGFIIRTLETLKCTQLHHVLIHWVHQRALFFTRSIQWPSLFSCKKPEQWIVNVALCFWLKFSKLCVVYHSDVYVIAWKCEAEIYSQT